MRSKNLLGCLDVWSFLEILQKDLFLGLLVGKKHTLKANKTPRFSPLQSPVANHLWQAPGRVLRALEPGRALFLRSCQQWLSSPAR